MKRNFNISNNSGFSLMEVMVAIGILAISLVALLDVQGGSINLASRTKGITVATLLARSKMVDIEKDLFKEGFSEFTEEMEGDFSDEGWPDYRWSASLTKVKIPMPAGGIGDTGTDDGSGTGTGTSSTTGSNPYAGMMSGYTSFITDMISNALRECILTISWGDGRDDQTFTVSTHFVEYARSMPTEVPVDGGVSDLEQRAGLSNNNVSGGNDITNAAAQTKTSFTSGGGATKQ